MWILLIEAWALQHPCIPHIIHPARGRVVTAVTPCQWRHLLRSINMISARLLGIIKAKMHECALCNIGKRAGSPMCVPYPKLW